MKVLSPRAHGVVDYAVVLLFALAPTLFGLTGTAATLAYALAAVHLVVTLLTAFPMGVAGVIAPHVHGLVELVVAISLMGIGMFNFGLEQAAGLFYLLAGLVILVVWLLSSYREVAAQPES
ncbi:MAG: hypothetical protein ACODAB_02520 [Gemmatimonadota bacterium]